MSNIEVTPRSVLGYIMIAFALVLWIIVIVSSILLLLGILEPIMVPDIGRWGTQLGIDEIMGIVLQLGIYSLLAGIGYGLAKNGTDLVKS